MILKKRNYYWVNKLKPGKMFIYKDFENFERSKNMIFTITEIPKIIKMDNNNITISVPIFPYNPLNENKNLLLSLRLIKEDIIFIEDDSKKERI